MKIISQALRQGRINFLLFLTISHGTMQMCLLVSLLVRAKILSAKTIDDKTLYQAYYLTKDYERKIYR